MHRFELPREVWEQVFDQLGINLRKPQLVCRLFRDIAARSTWGNLCISLTNSPTAYANVIVPRRRIAGSFDVFVPVARYFNHLTLELGHTLALEYDLDPILKPIRLALHNASDILVTIRRGTFIDPIGSALLPDLRAVSSKLTVRVKDKIPFSNGHLESEELVEALSLVESLTTSMELDILVRRIGQLPVQKAAKYLKSLSLDIRSTSVRDIDQLLDACPNLESLSLSTEFAAYGVLALPENVTGFEIYGNRHIQRPLDEYLLVSTKFVTFLRLSASALKLPYRFDLPNLRTLELVNLQSVGGSVLEGIQQLTRGSLDRFAIEGGISKCLPVIAPLVCGVKEEICLMRMARTSPFRVPMWKGTRRFLSDLLNFMSFPPKARRIQVELRFFEPELMKAFLKAMLYPGLESLRTTNYYAYDIEETEGFDQYPYLREVLPSHVFGQGLHMNSYKLFEVDVPYIRASDPQCDGEVYEMLDNISVLMEGIPSNLPSLFS